MKTIDKWMERAFSLENMNDWQGLLDWCLKWTESEPENAKAWCSLGNAYNKLDRYDDAFEAYNQEMNVNPEMDIKCFRLRNSYVTLFNHKDDEIEVFRQAVIGNSDDAIYWFRLGNVYCEHNRYKDAVESFRQAVRMDPDYAKELLRCVASAALSGDLVH